MKATEIAPMLGKHPSHHADAFWVSKLPPLQPGENPLSIFRFDGLEIVDDVTLPVDDPDAWELD